MPSNKEATTKDTTKTTVRLPTALHKELKRRVAISEDEISIAKIISSALRIFFRSNLDWKETKNKAILELNTSDDPEDMFAFELPVSSVMVLYVASRDALIKAGVKLPDLE